MSDSERGFPLSGLGAAFAEIPTADQMVERSAASMNQRLGGRPALSDDERKKTTSVSLSRESLAYLRGFEKTSGRSRSELIDTLITITKNDPSALLGALRGDVDRPPFTEAEVAAIAKVAGDAIAAYTTANPSESLGDMRLVVQAMYAAAADSVRANR